MNNEPDKRIGPLRMVCLLCGREIKGTPIPSAGGKIAPLVSGEAVSILTYRNGQPAGTGFAHPSCANGEMVHDLTGKPDYTGYNEDAAQPAYFDSRVVVPETLPTAFDAPMPAWDGDPKL